MNKKTCSSRTKVSSFVEDKAKIPEYQVASIATVNSNTNADSPVDNNSADSSRLRRSRAIAAAASIAIATANSKAVESTATAAAADLDASAQTITENTRATADAAIASANSWTLVSTRRKKVGKANARNSASMPTAAIGNAALTVNANAATELDPDSNNNTKMNASIAAGKYVKASRAAVTTTPDAVKIANSNAIAEAHTASMNRAVVTAKPDTIAIAETSDVITAKVNSDTAARAAATTSATPAGNAKANNDTAAKAAATTSATPAKEACHSSNEAVAAKLRSSGGAGETPDTMVTADAPPTAVVEDTGQDPSTHNYVITDIEN